MTTAETAKILSVLTVAFPTAYRNLPDSDVKSTIMLWDRFFGEESYEDVNAAIMNLIAHRVSGFAVTIGEVNEELEKIKQKRLSIQRSIAARKDLDRLLEKLSEGKENGRCLKA